MNDVNE